MLAVSLPILKLFTKNLNSKTHMEMLSQKSIIHKI